MADINTSKNNEALLIMNNRGSHLSIPVIDFANENGESLLTSYLRCSNKLQRSLNVSD